MDSPYTGSLAAARVHESISIIAEDMIEVPTVVVVHLGTVEQGPPTALVLQLGLAESGPLPGSNGDGRLRRPGQRASGRTALYASCKWRLGRGVQRPEGPRARQRAEVGLPLVGIGVTGTGHPRTFSSGPRFML